MPDPRYVQPEPATVPPSPWAADLKPFKPYVYRGTGYDIYQEARCPRSTRPSGTGAASASAPQAWSRARADADPTPRAPDAAAALPAATSLATTMKTGEFDHSEIPSGCTCTWSWGPPSFRWVRIGVKESCPWHRLADAVDRAAREGWKL